MSTEKPRLVIYTDQETLNKLDIIAKTQNRSRGNLSDTILKDYIRSYEEEHGRINSAELSVTKTG